MGTREIAEERIRKERIRRATEPIAYPKPAARDSAKASRSQKDKKETIQEEIARKNAQNRGARALTKRMPRKTG